EAVDLTMEAFEIADRYRNPVLIVGDGIIGQMMEPVEFKDPVDLNKLPKKEWATDGAKNRDPNVINSLALAPQDLEDHNLKLKAKYDKMKEKEVRYEKINTEDADIIIVAYGTTARIASSAIEQARKEGYKVGMIRPITLFPFPTEVISEAADKADNFLAVEMSTGQMVEDVRLAVNGKRPVHFYGRTGGVVPAPEEIVDKIKEIGGDK
ncbi:MAG: 3-methyl-2-oxobutanoate dehydrogenase subunit beta, partial [Halanaerobiales bacterium]|nr:3-methyl-2-oxobutanoate dehydrogenase subunit beta [Halanaerobiales bacterium]